MKWKVYCPFIRELCINGHCNSMGQDPDGEHIRCGLWVTLKGKDPQSENMFEEGRCSWAWLPIIQLESNQNQLFTIKSVDKVANEVNKINLALPLPQENRLVLEMEK